MPMWGSGIGKPGDVEAVGEGMPRGTQAGVREPRDWGCRRQTDRKQEDVSSHMPFSVSKEKTYPVYSFRSLHNHTLPKKCTYIYIYTYTH